MYNPEQLMEEYELLEHGAARKSAIREAIRQADENQDVPYQIYFRGELCNESTFYGDDLDMLTVFPEMLAIADNNPDAATPPCNSGYVNSMDYILWIYKWVLEACQSFYQIPLEDWKCFLEDFKQRSLAFGYNLKPYYVYLTDYYKAIGDASKEEECMSLSFDTPRDGNANCKACEQNSKVDYYLKKEELDKAAEYAKVLDSQELRCGKENSSWLRLKTTYMHYHMRKQEYDKAEEYIKLIDRHNNGRAEYDIEDDKLKCYSYLNIDKALRIYKKKWKEWQGERCPDTAYNVGMIECIFFKKLMSCRKRQTIKIEYDRSFPLYRESNTYDIQELYDYYYQYTYSLAEKFDKRNGTDCYKKKLHDELEKE